MSGTLYTLLKVSLSAVVILAITEIARRSTLFAALVASLPLVSIMAFVWLHVEQADNARIASVSGGIFWLVIPSQTLFLVLPLMLRAGVGFWPSLLTAIAATILAYGLMWWLLQRLGISV